MLFRSEILSDNGPGFRNEVLNHLCERLSIHHKYVTPYHPQCNGLNEKFNGELKLMMTKMIQGKEKSWDLELNRVLWAYRIAMKPSMQFSPYQLVYGKQAILPLDVKIPALKLLIEIGQEPVDNYKNRLNAL